MINFRRTVLFALLAVLPLAAGGCGPSVAPAMGDYVDVTGTVTLPDGKPLKAGTVSFQPVTPGQGREDMAVVADGTFKLKMFVAKYKVAFDVDSRKTAVPTKFTKYATSDLQADVSNSMQPLTFALK